MKLQRISRPADKSFQNGPELRCKRVTRPERACGGASAPSAKPQDVPRTLFVRHASAIPRGICFVLVTLAWLSGAPCAAHQKWLLPSFFVAEKGPAWLSFDVTWSDRPFTAESGVGAQPLWIVDPSGRRQAPPTVFVGKTKSVAEVELTEPGTYRLESIDPLTYWTQVEQDGRIQWLQKSKNEVEAGQVKRSDLYWSKAIAYVTLGETSDVPPPDDAEPLDLRLEQHPNRLKLGETLKIQVVSRGKPLPRAEVKTFGPDAVGHKPSSVTRCGEDGHCTIQPEAAGRFLFACQLEREVTDDPKADIHSFNIYLTLEIQPRGE
jgi:uncharacterized GH25 family protein